MGIYAFQGAAGVLGPEPLAAQHLRTVHQGRVSADAAIVAFLSERVACLEAEHRELKDILRDIAYGPGPAGQAQGRHLRAVDPWAG